MHSPTVRDALTIISTGLKTSDTGGVTFLETRCDLVFFGYVVMAPKVESADQIADAAVAIIFNIMRSLCGPVARLLSPPLRLAALCVSCRSGPLLLRGHSH
jgi:hypothetical protein